MTEQELREEYRKCVESFEYWRDTYVIRKRTEMDWTEICYKISAEKDISLREAVKLYKQDRQKWIDWFNELLIKGS